MPPAAAYLLTDRLVPMLVIGALIAVASSLVGYPVAVALDVSIGGTMAVMTGVFLALAFLFGPRHGLVAQEWQRHRQRYADESRALVVHLYEHEHTPQSDRENIVPALQRHLGWSATKADAVLQRSLRNGLVVRDGTMLYLTNKGRGTARALIEPWAPQGA